MRRTVRISLLLSLLCAVGSTALAQEDIDPRYRTADTNNAVIHGRVTLPSGYLLDGYAKITLRTAQSVVQVIHTDKVGEFQILNLSEGVYFVQGETLDGVFEPVTKRIELGRGLRINVNLEMREKKAQHLKSIASRVVSAAELRQQVPASAKKAYDQGLQAVKKGKFAEAATYFEQALQFYPDYLAARNDLGAQYLKLKRIDEAEKHFQIVLTNDPKNFNAKYNMGLVQFERHDYVGALALLNEAISFDSTRAVPHLWIGIVKLEMGNLQEAETSLVRSLLMGGEECVAAHYHLARIYVSRGEMGDATRSIQAYLQQAPRGEYSKEAKDLALLIEKPAK